MKTKSSIIVLCLVIISITKVFSQDENIEQLSVLYKNQVKKLSDTVDGFKGPNQLIRGYQWGNNRSVSQAIYFNQNNVFDRQLFIDNKANMAQAQKKSGIFKPLILSIY